MLSTWGSSTGKAPTLDLQFAGATSLDTRVTFTRSTTATYFDSTGTLQTAAINAPRFDYNPSTLAPLGLLIEEARTNSIRNNTMQGAVAGTPGTLPTNWSVGSAVGLTTNVIGTGTSKGITYIDVQITGTTTGTTYALVPEPATQIVGSNGQAWSSSAWWSLVAGDLTNVTAYFFDIRELDSGGVQLSSGGIAVSAPSATFTRITASRTNTNASTAYVQPRFRFTVTNGAAVNFTLRIGLPQLELGAFATSVIPTTSAAVQRTADVASMTGTNFSSWYNATQGTLYSQFQVPSALVSGAALRVASIQNVGGVDEIMIQVNQASGKAASGNVFTSSVNAGRIDVSTAYVANASTKAAYAFASGDRAITSGGTTPNTSSAAFTMPTVNTLRIGAQDSGATNFINGWIQRITYYPTRLANSTLQALTA